MYTCKELMGCRVVCVTVWAGGRCSLGMKVSAHSLDALITACRGQGAGGGCHRRGHTLVGLRRYGVRLCTFMRGGLIWGRLAYAQDEGMGQDAQWEVRVGVLGACIMQHQRMLMGFRGVE